MDDKTKYYENRDLSWLSFNLRCLEESEDKNNPLFERAFFSSIWQTNLDEFCMVRIGGLHDRLLYKKEIIDPKSGMTVEQQLSAIFLRLSKLLKRADKCFSEIEKEFEEYGIKRLSYKSLSKFEENYMEKYFEKEILPLLSPITISGTERFPFIANGDINLCVLTENKDGTKSLGIVPIKEPVQRVIMLPSAKHKYILIEDVIYHFAGIIFKKSKIIDKTVFRITRNADLDADEAFADHENLEYREIMKTLLKKRKKLSPVRIEFYHSSDGTCEQRLLRRIKLPKKASFKRSIPLSLSFLKEIKELVKDKKELFFPPLVPQYSPALPMNGSLIERIKQKDVLLSYPFENINSFIYLLNEASMNPFVKSIKITLYREAHNSKIVNSLIAAAENGIEVMAMVELRARFDEDHNIFISKQLEDSGVKVIYGIEDYKVHSKVLLITMEENGEKSYITQVGTGNYNEITSRLYTDLSYITARKEFAKDAKELFTSLKRGKFVQKTKALLIAPLCFKSKLMALIDEQISAQHQNGNGRIIIKANSLSDTDMIDKLVLASQLGVKIDLIIRGICCLKLCGKKTENITIRSIVGRYLEHSRIYMFGSEPDERKIFIASADLMSRNTKRRVEVGAPILDEDAKKYIEKLISLQLSDNVKARFKKGSEYVRKVPKDGEKLINSQEELFALAYRNSEKK